MDTKKINIKQTNNFHEKQISLHNGNIKNLESKN